MNKLISLCAFLVLLACTPDSNQEQAKQNRQEKTDHSKGSFGYDLNFLRQHYDDLLLLQDEDAQVIVSPALQGRVMTSTAEGESGKSFGWLNYELIESGEIEEHFNPTGGEERFWLGPEGGQFSIFFKAGASFEFDNWYVPKEIDTEPFELVSKTSQEARFKKSMELTNYSGTDFKLKVDRVVRLMDRSKTEELLSVKIPENTKWIGFETENSIQNTGDQVWNGASGMLSIWILSMFKPSPSTTVIVPFKAGSESDLGKIVTDDYFGKVPADRLILKEEVMFFKADGNKRSKIGISPQRALPISGSYDAENGVLTVAHYSLSKKNAPYVNSLWEIQEEPFKGDAVNAYNDGPLENGDQLGPFYEIESSSPAASLEAGDCLTHFHRTFHFRGTLRELNQLSLSIFKLSIEEIEAVFD
ncbi:MAG: DUF6786 family protein [Bacteroidia bacterium]|nr:DUF6786 family protein [Bacteroidia bacterium]